METGTFLDREWESIFKMFSTNEPNFPGELLGYSPPSSQDDNLSLRTSSSLVPEDNVVLNHSQNEYADLLLATDICFPDDIYMRDVKNDSSFPLLFLQEMNDEVFSVHKVSSACPMNNADDSVSVNRGSLCVKRKRNESEIEAVEGKIDSFPTRRKKARASVAAHKGKRKNNRKDEDDYNGGNGQNLSSGSSDSESNATEIPDEIEVYPSVSVSTGVNSINNVQENPESKETVMVTLQGKKRASRGAATDPQSLYARRRRMRINERLKILQNLVPNGTKVDISTMLEEAFHYVKFLQLQIKLLSSDELWMYAPIAYNGHDVSLYQKVSPFQWP